MGPGRPDRSSGRNQEPRRAAMGRRSCANSSTLEPECCRLPYEAVTRSAIPCMMREGSVQYMFGTARFPGAVPWRGGLSARRRIEHVVDPVGNLPCGANEIDRAVKLDCVLLHPARLEARIEHHGKASGGMDGGKAAR